MSCPIEQELEKFSSCVHRDLQDGEGPAHIGDGLQAQLVAACKRDGASEALTLFALIRNFVAGEEAKRK